MLGGNLLLVEETDTRMAPEVEVELERSPFGSGIMPRGLRGLRVEAEPEVLGVALPRRRWPIGLKPRWISCAGVAGCSLLDTRIGKSTPDGKN